MKWSKLFTVVITFSLLSVMSIGCGTQDSIQSLVPPPTSSSNSAETAITTSNEDVEWLSMAISSEAGSVYDGGKWVRCTDEERVAVGWTIINRLKAGTYGDSIKDIISAQNQYAYNQQPSSDIIKLAEQLLEGTIDDITEGATHFFSPISMPKEGESTSGFDTAGGLNSVTGINSNVYFPSWTETMDYVDDLLNIRQKYFMFYSTREIMGKSAPTIDKVPSSGELFTLEKEGVYHETASARGVLRIITNEVKYSPEGEKYWLIALENITNRVIDIELVVDWKDPSGKSLETEEKREHRFLPENTWGEQFEFPRSALGPVFWVEVNYPKPIPSKVQLNYVELPSAKGRIELSEANFYISDKGSVYEHWKTDSLTMTNISGSVILNADLTYEFYSEQGKIEGSSGHSSFEYINLGDRNYILDDIRFPYEATELRVSIDVKETLPSQVTVDYSIDPTIEEAWELTLSSPSIEKGRRWVISGRFSKYAFLPFSTIEIYVSFDKGQGELAIPVTIMNTSRDVGNPIIQKIELETLDRTFKISYPIESAHAVIRIVNIP